MTRIEEDSECIRIAESLTDAFEEGYRVAAYEIRHGNANFIQARERGVSGTQDQRIYWDRGYDAAICAYRLGHDVDKLVQAEIYEISTQSDAAVVMQLLDGKWRNTRPDPRKRQNGHSN